MARTQTVIMSTSAGVSKPKAVRNRASKLKSFYRCLEGKKVFAKGSFCTGFASQWRFYLVCNDGKTLEHSFKEAYFWSNVAKKAIKTSKCLTGLIEGRRFGFNIKADSKTVGKVFQYIHSQEYMEHDYTSKTAFGLPCGPVDISAVQDELKEHSKIYFAANTLEMPFLTDLALERFDSCWRLLFRDDPNCLGRNDGVAERLAFLRHNTPSPTLEHEEFEAEEDSGLRNSPGSRMDSATTSPRKGPSCRTQLAGPRAQHLFISAI